MRSVVRNVSLLLCTLALSCRPAINQTSGISRNNAGTAAKIGRWTARWQNGGLYLDYDRVPLTRGGLVQVFAPNYARGYYGSGSRPPDAVVTQLPDGGRSYTALFHYAEDGRTFDGTQTIDVHPTDRVVYTIHARWQAPDTAQLEWNPLRLWAYPLVGSAYTAHSGNGPIANMGRISYIPLPGSYPATRLALPGSTLTFTHTAVGTLTFSGQAGPDGPILYDGREDPYLQDEKVFWGGYPALEMKPGQEMTYTLTLAVTPAPASAPTTEEKHPASAMLKPVITSLPAALSSLPPLQDRDGHPVIIPQPKQADFTLGDYPLRGALPVTLLALTGNEGRRVREEATRLTAALQRNNGISSLIELSNEQSGAWNGRGLLVAIGSEGKSHLSPPLPTAPPHPEGYALQVAPQYIAVIGSDAAGAYYGLQTLRQLLRHDAKGRARFVGATITDWPSLPFRGAHLFVGRHALPFHQKLIERIFSRYKLNKMVIECEYAAWKSHSEIHVDYSMPLDDLQADVAYARDHFMEPIPLVNSLGHSQWIFANGQHRDIVEDPHVPYAYNVSNPDTYKFLFDIYQETIDIFHPRLFHIGHDEVKIPGTDQFGKYPARPENVRKGITQLFVEDTNRLSDWLRQRGVRPMLWGDMLLHPSEGTPQPAIAAMSAANATSPEEARARRAQLPHDAVIADWRYAAGSEQRNGLATLKQAGFETLGCAWYEPENIRGWAQQAIRNGALGTLQTTWAGYDSNESLLDTSEYKQFTAFVLAAEYAWSGASLPTNALPYNAANVFARSYRDAHSHGRSQSGWLLLPGNAANIRLTDDPQQALPWETYAQDHGAPTVSALTPDPETGIALPISVQTGIMLSSPISSIPSLPASVVLPINRKAHSLAFLHAAAYGVAFKAIAGTYVVVYADGKQVEIPLRYGLEIRSMDDRSPATSFSTSAVTAGKGALTLRLLQWRNPRPEATIARLVFHAGDLAAPILFAVTGVR